MAKYNVSQNSFKKLQVVWVNNDIIIKKAMWKKDPWYHCIFNLCAIVIQELFDCKMLHIEICN